MWDVVDNEFAWDFFANTGNIESYLLYKEYKNVNAEKDADEHDTDITNITEIKLNAIIRKAIRDTEPDADSLIFFPIFFSIYIGSVIAPTRVCRK